MNEQSSGESKDEEDGEGIGLRESKMEELVPE